MESSFIKKHIGITKEECKKMLSSLNVRSTQELIERSIPHHILSELPKDFQEGKSEYDYLLHLEHIAHQNKICKSYIGQGYYPTILPSVIQRNVLENPGWYTQYTPYQAEIAQGRLESLYYFQSMICDLTQLPIANASLLDEATASAEAMTMLLAENGSDRKKFFMDTFIFSQTKRIIQTRAEALGVIVVEGDSRTTPLDESYFGACIQQPNSEGSIQDLASFLKQCKDKKIGTVVVADILSLCLISPPGSIGADIAVGSTQRLGVPMGYGGPHAAYIACKEQLKRLLPGRIIGKSIDKHGKTAYRMALQTREQHIRREKATSNICTAQALLANIATMYAIYHGADGLKEIAKRIATLSYLLSTELKKTIPTVAIVHSHFFDTLKINAGEDAGNIKKRAEKVGINLYYYHDQKHISISLSEVTTIEDVAELVSVFSGKTYTLPSFSSLENSAIPSYAHREQPYLEHNVFQHHRDETKMMRFIKKLEQKDLSLNNSMIPLGSCTMKLNAASELSCLSMPSFMNIHPFAPLEQTKGYQYILDQLANFLCQITGLDACSLQPNSGAQGEFAGLMCIRKYLKSKGEEKRNLMLIPISAHGTNPASAKMAGFDICVIKCKENGEIDTDHLREVVENHKDILAGLMVTYPSTYGVFDENIQEVCMLIHHHGGQVYMDGANMNAQVGLTSPSIIGADVCHINLHKTFAIPHGGGGPGMGPICVKKHLSPYLPSTQHQTSSIEKESYFISATPYGSASICIISYGYIYMMGRSGLTQASTYAILNANYMRERLAPHYNILFKNKQGCCAHEFIVDCRSFKQTAGIEVEDIAKRLMDYGFHAPTVSFPVPGTLMIEPTESENKAELDRFCDALVSIRQEIALIEKGEMPTDNNHLKNAPHSYETLCANEWNYPYAREGAAFPLDFVRDQKFWVPVSRINQAHGDRNLVCSCIPISEYA